MPTFCVAGRSTAERQKAPIEATADPDEELSTSEAAKLLDLKTNTVRSYIRSGRLPGRYDPARGRLTTRGVVDAYKAARNR